MTGHANQVALVGAGGHAKVVIATARALGMQVTAVFDDDDSRWGQELCGVPVRGPVAAVAERAVIAIGNNRVRKQLAQRIEVDWLTLCHPSALVDASVRLGPGTVVFAGAVIQPDAHVGAHAIINTGASVDHDCTIGDFAHVAPGVSLCGGVSLDEGVLVGVGASLCPSVQVGEWSIVGAGAVCVHDVGGSVTVAGVPARIVGAPDE